MGASERRERSCCLCVAMLSSPPFSARHSSPEELLEPLRKKVKLEDDATSDTKAAMGIALKQSKLQGLPAVRAQYKPLIPPTLKVSTIACSLFLFCSVLFCAVMCCGVFFFLCSHPSLSFLP